jgi:ankyrin repeat protein
MSPLHDACMARDLLAVQAAIRTGHGVNKVNEAGVTPLMCAALVNCRETAEELLTQGATVGCVGRCCIWGRLCFRR